MTKRYEEFGRNDPLIQALTHAMATTAKRTINQLHQTYELEVVLAMMTMAVGVAIGQCHAVRAKHNEECEGCAKRGAPEYYELGIKNFGAGFRHGKMEVEQEHANAASAADDLLENILRKHGEEK